MWKANRAKNRQRNRLKQLAGSFQAATEQIAAGIHSRSDSKEKLRFLMEEWDFYLPTATAILTILYPDEFTVYDYRVCEEIGEGKRLANRGFSDSLWQQLQTYKMVVISASPNELSLRDKDRWLTGRSFRKQIEKDWEL